MDIKPDTYIVNDIVTIAKRCGYGRVMQELSDAWQEKSTNEGRVGEGLVIGPHAGLTTSCDCDKPSNCDWCCGSGWLTRHVKSLNDSK